MKAMAINPKQMFLSIFILAIMFLSGCAGTLQPRKPVGSVSELDLRDEQYTYYNDDEKYANVPAEELEKVAAAMMLMAEAKKKAAEAELALAKADAAKAKAAAIWTKQERKKEKELARQKERERKDKLKADKERAKRWRDYNKSIRDTVDTAEHIVKAPLKPFNWLFKKKK